MKQFFLNQNHTIPFKLGGIIHIGCILFLILSIVMIYKNRERITKIKRKQLIKNIMFIILIANMLTYYSSYIYYGVYNWKVHLPLHFCFISGGLFMIYLITKNIKVYKVVYFFALMGPLPAVLFPDLTTSFDSFIFYQYFISHHLFIIFSFFVYYLDDVNIKIKDLLATLICANAIFLIMYIFNNIFGTNYIMSQQLPTHVLKLFPFLTGFNSPILILEITGTVVAFIAYIPVYLKHREDKMKDIVSIIENNSKKVIIGTR